jgi:hypothetical protein
MESTTDDEVKKNALENIEDDDFKVIILFLAHEGVTQPDWWNKWRAFTVFKDRIHFVVHAPKDAKYGKDFCDINSIGFFDSNTKWAHPSIVRVYLECLEVIINDDKLNNNSIIYLVSGYCIPIQPSYNLFSNKIKTPMSTTEKNINYKKSVFCKTEFSVDKPSKQWNSLSINDAKIICKYSKTDDYFKNYTLNWYQNKITRHVTDEYFFKNFMECMLVILSMRIFHVFRLTLSSSSSRAATNMFYLLRSSIRASGKGVIVDATCVDLKSKLYGINKDEIQGMLGYIKKYDASKLKEEMKQIKDLGLLKMMEDYEDIREMLTNYYSVEGQIYCTTSDIRNKYLTTSPILWNDIDKPEKVMYMSPVYDKCVKVSLKHAIYFYSITSKISSRTLFFRKISDKVDLDSIKDILTDNYSESYGKYKNIKDEFCELNELNYYKNNEILLDPSQDKVINDEKTKEDVKISSDCDINEEDNKKKNDLYKLLGRNEHKPLEFNEKQINEFTKPNFTFINNEKLISILSTFAPPLLDGEDIHDGIKKLYKRKSIKRSKRRRSIKRSKRRRSIKRSKRRRSIKRSKRR